MSAGAPIDGGRPGAVVDLDSTSAPMVVWHGNRFRRVRLPTGTRAIAPPDPAAPLEDVDAAVRTALAAPVAGSSLREQLRRGMRLTIVIDDDPPRPQRHGLDPRQRIVEAVLDDAASAELDDVALILARGLRRRLTGAELRVALGDRVYDSFAPREALLHHDAEAEDLIVLGDVAGTPVAVNRRVHDSDLVIHIALHDDAGSGTWTRFATSLTGRPTALAAMVEPAHRRAVEQLLADAIPTFSVHAVLSSASFPAALAALQEREWEWTSLHRARNAIIGAALDVLPDRLVRRALRRLLVDERTIAVLAGDASAASTSAAARSVAQRAVRVQGHVDIAHVGPPDPGLFDGVVTDPIVAASTALVHAACAHSDQSIVRAGGVVVLHHPLRPTFDPVRRPANLDFYNDVLPSLASTLDLLDHPAARDPDPYGVHLYRSGHASNPVEAFALWADVARARARLAAVVVVGGDHQVTNRLGFRSASSLHDALEIAKEVCGTTAPSVAHLQHAPTPLPEVR